MNWIILVLFLSTHAREQLERLPYTDIGDRRACLIGTKQDDQTLRIDSIVDMDWKLCSDRKHVLGFVHSHPTNEQCWYYFPGTQDRTEDGRYARESSYPVDAIACPSKLVWINKAGTVSEVQW